MNKFISTIQKRGPFQFVANRMAFVGKVRQTVGKVKCVPEKVQKKKTSTLFHERLICVRTRSKISPNPLPGTIPTVVRKCFGTGTEITTRTGSWGCGYHCGK